MTDQELEQRLRGWYGTDDESIIAPSELRQAVLEIATATPGSDRALHGRRGLTLLVAATLLIGGALAAGSGIFRLPAVVRQDTPAPSEADRSTPAPSVAIPSDGPTVPSERLPAAPLTQGAINTVNTFLLATETVGWAGATDGILRTEDMGTTWRDVTPAGWSGTAGTALIDSATAYVASDSTPMTIAATHDGGASWTEAVIDNTETAFGPWFAFQTPDLGFATFFERSDQEKLRVYATTDGGQTWTGPRIGRIPKQPNTMTKLQPSTGGVYALVPGKADNQPFMNRFRLSIDGGATWKTADFPVGPGSPKPVQKSIGRIWLQAGVMTMAMTANDRGSLWRSRDGAVTWELIRTMPKDVPFGNAVFASPTSWLTMPNGPNEIDVTEDAGAHWRTIAVAETPLDPWDVSFATTRAGWGVLRCGLHGGSIKACEGSVGQSFLMTTSDGGATWSRMTGTAPAADAPASGAAGAWVDAGSMAGPAGQNLPAVHLDDDRVFVVGGQKTVLYDPTTGRWTAGGRPLQERYGAIIAKLANGSILLAGGSYGDKDHRTTELYDPATGRWTVGPSMRRARANFRSAVLSDGRVLVAGGESGKPVSAEIYDPVTRRWSLTGRPHMTDYGGSPLVVLENGHVLTCGGVTDTAQTPSAKCEIFDPATDTWASSADMTQPRADPSAIVLSDGRVLVVGGAKSYAGRELPTAELFDPATETWMPTAPMPVSSTERTVALLRSGRVLVAGGGDPSAGTMGALAIAQMFDPETGVWTRLADLRESRIGATAVSLDDGTVLLVGGHGTGFFVFLSSAERFYPDGAPTP